MSKAEAKSSNTSDGSEPSASLISQLAMERPSTSSLLDRVQAFLPQLKAANETLPDAQEEEEEPVQLEEFSSDSGDEDEDSSEESDSETSEEEDGDSSREPSATPSATREEQGSLQGLLDVGAPPAAKRRKLEIVELD